MHKIFISCNLGANRQASVLEDNTELSAGWYWQFNRKQGYRNTGGTGVTPSWTITSINEQSDWLPVNDPCTIELGSPWRIPTFSEWFNVDNTYGWNDWWGPWGSMLRLHTAGYLVHKASSRFAGMQRGMIGISAVVLALFGTYPLFLGLLFFIGMVE